MTWDLRSLGEICELYQPKTISRKQMDPNGAYPVYGANGEIGRYSNFNHAEEEVLLSCRGNCGTVNISQPKSWINGNAMVCKPKTADISKDYLALALRSINWTPIITGTAQPQITRSPLSAVTIPVPPLDDQRRIVAQLENQLGRLEATRRRLDLLENEVQVLYSSTVSGIFSTAVEPSSSSSTLGSVSQIINGDRGKNYPSKSMRTALGVPFVNAGDLGEDGNISDGHDFISEETFEVLSSGKFRKGDVLYCIRGSLGKSSINKSLERGAIASSLVIIRTGERLNEDYLLYFLRSSKGLAQINKYDNGTAQPNLSAANLAKFELPLPSIEKQEQIIKLLTRISETIANCRKRVVESRRLISVAELSILHRAFSGPEEEL